MRILHAEGAKMEIQLKLKNGNIIDWEAKSGDDAVRQYLECHPETTIKAWREKPYGLYIFNHNNRIIE